MPLYFAQLGRNKNLSVAEVGAVCGFHNLVALNGDILAFNFDFQAIARPIARFGGIIALYQSVAVFDVCPTVDEVSEIFPQLVGQADSKVSISFESRLVDLEFTRKVLKESKKLFKNLQMSIRYIEKPSTSSFIHSGFFKNKVFALTLQMFEGKFHVLRLVDIQDIDNYTVRDIDKPFRDSRIGMLPPKLAQIMVNLAGDVKSVYDPFCGTGTVLLECMLRSLNVFGSDLSPICVSGTEKNVAWIKNRFNLSDIKSRLFVRDCSKITADDVKDVDCIVTEGFLGLPQASNATRDVLLHELSRLEDLYFSFLKAVSESNKKSNFNVVICLPVFSFGSENLYMENVVEKAASLGYIVSALIPEPNPLNLKFKPSILYQRSDQKVMRQIIRFVHTPL